MKKTIRWDEKEVTTTKKSLTVKFPVFFIDEYGFYNYSPNEKETIEIGLYGTQSNKEDSHSIETRKYFSAERYIKRKRDISLNEWREALSKVKKYVEWLMAKTLIIVISLMISLNVTGQTNWKITEIVGSKGQTVWVKAIEANSGQQKELRINCRGMGKRPNLIGRNLSYYPNGKGRRKVKVIFDKL